MFHIDPVFTNPMLRRTRRAAALAGVLAALALPTLGCGGGGSGGGSPAASKSGGAPPAAGPVSPLNQGPKAFETVSLNPGLADWGAKVFETRACVTCHTFGEDKQGPDLSGVARRRTEAWITKQVTDPEWMVKNDPISREMFGKFALQMANQHVPEQEVKALIHFLVRESQGQ
jgi:cytochrome c551/c552